MKIKKLLVPFFILISLFLATPSFAAAPQFTAARPTFLFGGGITSTASTIRLTALVTPDGTAITTAQLVGGIGSVFYITIEPATSKKETVSCTAVTQNGDNTATLTGCTRGLQFTYPYTASSALAISHSGGSSVVLSNSPQLYQDIIAYVNSSFSAGVNNASTIAKGIVALGTANQAASHSAIGSGSTDAALVLTTNIASSTRTANTAQVVIASSTTGYIDSSYFSPTSNIASSTTVGSPPVNILDIGKNFFFASSTKNFTIPGGVTKIFVRMCGGGGDSGNDEGGAHTTNSGGAAGGYVEGFFDVSATSSIGITINATSGTGGTVFLSSMASTTGGARGNSAAGSGSIGGMGFVQTSSTTTTITTPGAPGEPGAAATGATFGGNGGSSLYGGGGAGVPSGTPNNAIGFCSGGGASTGTTPGAGKGRTGAVEIIY